jgi:hypothetical protein
MVELASPVYGERNVILRYRVSDLLWRPAGRLVRFVAVIHPTRGSCLLMSTDLSLSAVDIIHVYGLRFKIEHSFKQATRLIGAFAYHFWMMDMTPLRTAMAISIFIVSRPTTATTLSARYAPITSSFRPASSPKGCTSTSPSLPQSSFGLLRIVVENHSSGHPAVRICRSQRAAFDASRLSPRFPRKRFPREIHRRSSRHRQHADFPIGRMNRKRHS